MNTSSFVSLELLKEATLAATAESFKKGYGSIRSVRVDDAYVVVDHEKKQPVIEVRFTFPVNTEPTMRYLVVRIREDLKRSIEWRTSPP